MAQESSAALPPTDATNRKRKKHPKGDRGVERRKSMVWKQSIVEEDPFALLADGEEGGFLSLEEMDEADYGFMGGFPEPMWGTKLPSSAKSKKRKCGSGGEDGTGSDDSVVEDEGEVKKANTKKRRKKKRAKAKKEKEKIESKEDSVVEISEEAGTLDSNFVSADASEITNFEDHNQEDFIFQNDDYRAWKKLKLHPILMKSIRRLGFKEPTPIQKACIPAAAHQGKDVIGAAETGSGKTLAFGLPILHSLLREHDKAAMLLKEDPDDVEGGAHGSTLRALILAPTRELALQVSDHLKEVAKLTNIRVVPIVGGMSTEKQVRLLKKRPQVIVGTPGRLWELMSGGEPHLVELSSLSFFVLDEADRMIENGHFNELESIIDMLPSNGGFIEPCSQAAESCNTVSGSLQNKRQTFVFSATIALSDNFRKKLRRGFLRAKPSSGDGLSSIERLSERAGMRADVAVVDLTNASIVAEKLEESFIECNEENKEAYLYYILSVHGQGRTIVFCTSISALRRISSILRILDITVLSLHAQMQQRARLKAIDRFRENANGVLVATDVAARGLDIPGVRTVIHYQLPHSAEKWQDS
uniref:DEAD-box ATP-dependent RNA helicase 13 n=1 Tax=Anthurium amnicola TaxID=1678845 RepID=A0A1D1XUE2_9ARAE